MRFLRLPELQDPLVSAGPLIISRYNEDVRRYFHTCDINRAFGSAVYLSSRDRSQIGRSIGLEYGGLPGEINRYVRRLITVDIDGFIGR